MLHAENLSITPGRARVPAVSGFELELAPGRAVAIVGPSGCGKSTLARALVGLEPRMSGSLRWRGTELVGAAPARWRAVRGEIALCWQDAAAALDPRQSVRAAIAEARALASRPGLTAPQLDALLERVRLSPALRERRPGELSGGQRQRAALARALAGEPRLLIADEVTSAVDRSIALELRDELFALPATGVAIILITHDLSLLGPALDELVVLERGRVVERGEPSSILRAPRHALTRALIEAIPALRRPASTPAQ